MQFALSREERVRPERVDGPVVTMVSWQRRPQPRSRWMDKMNLKEIPLPREWDGAKIEAGRRHRCRSSEGAVVLLIEPASTVTRGDA